jgi:uncharacterized membrane protein
MKPRKDKQLNKQKSFKVYGLGSKSFFFVLTGLLCLLFCLLFLTYTQTKEFLSLQQFLESIISSKEILNGVGKLFLVLAVMYGMHAMANKLKSSN